MVKKRKPPGKNRNATLSKYSRKVKTTTKQVAKLPRTVTRMAQTNTKNWNKAADKRRKALPPGRRISKKGKPYTETRRNRSDVRKKGL